MKQEQARTLAEQIHQDYAGRVVAQVKRTVKRGPGPDTGDGFLVRAALAVEGAPYLAMTLRYPSQVSRLREAWVWWLLSEAELAALPFPGPEKDEDEDEETDGAPLSFSCAS
jgi:NAD(P)H-hydrate repair Nnr-like enzyme with NAD(P)H-hydrate epimerase domain